MRKIILSAFFVAASFGLYAQNINDIQEKVSKNKWGEAREKLDKAASDPKAQTNSDFWFLKAKIYSQLGKESGDTALLAGSLDAIQRYFELESKEKNESKRALKSLLENHQTAFDVYTNYFQTGVKNFQAEDWAKAYYNFTKTVEAFNFLSRNKLTNAAFDTTATLYAGYAAQNARIPDEAAKYYQMLADRKIGDKDYIGVYEFLVSYYQQKNDNENRTKYLNLGKTLFPDHKNWLAYELQDLDKDKSKKLARLAELTQQNPNNKDLWLEYGYDLFNYVYAGDKPADYQKKQDELSTVLKHVISLDTNAVYSNYIMSQHLNNIIYDLQQDYAAIKGTKPEDVKKKQQLNKDIEAQYEVLFKYSNAAAQQFEKMSDLKAADKANYRNILMNLSDYYRIKKQADKVELYEEKAKKLS